MRVYRDADADQALIRARRVAIIGYGNQGRAQALNLRDSSVGEIAIALAEGSPTAATVRDDGIRLMAAPQAAAWADIVVMLAPDELHSTIYAESLAPGMKAGAALCFAHGFSIRFGLIEPRADLDVFLVAPKGPGSALRDLYAAGKGMISLFAVHQDATSEARALSLAYGAALGSGRAGMLETSFAEECEADLFNEQAVLWGAIPELIRAGFQTLVEAGFAPEIAYLECVGELKLIADLIDARGVAGMREAISNTAAFGAAESGPSIVTEATRREMKRILADVRAGGFAERFIADHRAGGSLMKTARRRDAASRLEQTGTALRALADRQA